MTTLLYILVPFCYVLAFITFRKYLTSRTQPRYLERHPYARRS